MSRFENEASTRGGGRSARLVVGQFATRRLGGVTGDVYGAVNELATMAMFVVAALLTVGDILPFEPLRIIEDSLNTGGGWAPYGYAP